jgi:glycosyltransferase involved in cell wall biosynthesis
VSQTNVLWVIDHVCYDGSLHGGGRFYWNVLPRFDSDRFRVIPCLLRATETIRQVFRNSPAPVRFLDKGKFDPTTLNSLLRLIKEEDIHVMHLHCYGASTFGRLVGLIARVPTVIHDYDTEVYFPYPWYLRIADTALAPLTGAAIAASPMVRDFLIRKRKVHRDKIHLMLHAVPLEKYQSVPEERVLRVKGNLGAGAETKIVGTFTKLGPQRGNDCLLKAAAEVLKVSPGVLFLLVYKPTYFHRLPSRKYVPVSTDNARRMINELKAAANQLGIERSVQFIEWPENIDETVAACDFVVAPFLSDRFSSVSLLEAMAMRKPAIATDLGEARQIVKNGINGYLVPAGDVNGLAGKMLKLLQEPGELNLMRQQAWAESQQYSAETCARTLENLYIDLITKRGYSQANAAKGLA